MLTYAIRKKSSSSSSTRQQKRTSTAGGITTVEAGLFTSGPIPGVLPDYSYPLECLTFAPLTCTLISDYFALFSASSHEGLFHAIRLLCPHRLRRIALSVSRVSAPRKHGLAPSAGCLSTNRQASQASTS